MRPLALALAVLASPALAQRVVEAPPALAPVTPGASGAAPVLPSPSVGLAPSPLPALSAPLAVPAPGASPSAAAPRASAKAVAGAAAPAAALPASAVPAAAQGKQEAPAEEPGSQDAAARAAALFDGASGRRAASAVAEPGGLGVGEVGHRGTARRRDWSVDGRPVDYVGGGGIKDVLAHPRSPDHVLALFNQHLRADPAISRTERDVELRGRRRLAELGAAPAVAAVGALHESRDKGSRTIHYLVAEKVRGTTLAEASEADLPLVRALFKTLVDARLRLTDRVHLLDNLMVGTTASKPARQAWVVDTEGVEEAAPRGLLERWRGRPDELAAYYDGLYREVAAGLRRRR